jgi:hypothetical protein
MKATHLKEGVEPPTENYVNKGNEHHDEENMGRNQSIDKNTSFSLLDQDHMSNDQVHKSRVVESKVSTQ